MAGKKVSKNAVVDRGVKKVLPGVPVRLVALRGAEFACPTCGKRMKNQIAYRVVNGENCSRHCASIATARAEAGE